MAVTAAPSLDTLAKQLAQCATSAEKLQLLNRHPYVKRFLLRSPDYAWAMGALTEWEEVAFKAVVAIGQGEIVFRLDPGMGWREPLPAMMTQLAAVERFFDEMGGIVGYHREVLALLGKPGKSPERTYHHPPGIDMRDPEQAAPALRAGIEALPRSGEIYPIGGAGDRLGLTDPETGEPLPAACLHFAGHTLFEGLIRDLQGREYLYEKLYGESIVTPIALMTSEEKENHTHILQILEANGWFGRPPESFNLFTQCLVPVVTEEGNWAMRGALDPVLKPGGHGVLWKLMSDQGVFDWFAAQGREVALIRQINNPISGLDEGLLTFLGAGVRQGKAFGFAACPRRVGTAEGVDVLVEEKGRYAITNIEYTDFAQHEIEDLPESEGSIYSAFPANTNILFAHLPSVREQVGRCMLPGPLLNMKNSAPFIDAEGSRSELPAGRLESTMQNIADTFWAESPGQVQVFVTYNDRAKTISVTKKSWKEGEPTLETPVGAWEDLLTNYRALLESCGMQVPDRFHFLMHPALGPLWSVIRQKVRGGRIGEGSELVLEIAELDLENLDLDGSLQILGRRPRQARCQLHDVKVSTKLQIELHGESEFEAKGVTFSEPLEVVVPEGIRVVASQEGSGVKLTSMPLAAPSWRWSYSWGESGIELSKES